MRRNIPIATARLDALRPGQNDVLLWPDRSRVNTCRRCTLWARATQGVPGEGSRNAPLFAVGEQPGADEDRDGEPFVGPAGRLLRSLLDRAGIAPADIYLTNAVKHFGWEPRGVRRAHKTPAQHHVDACHAWLEAELVEVEPRVVIALGRTALQSVLQRHMAIAEARGKPLALRDGTPVVATYHPSAVLRAVDPVRRRELERVLECDLKHALLLSRPPDKRES